MLNPDQDNRRSENTPSEEDKMPGNGKPARNGSRTGRRMPRAPLRPGERRHHHMMGAPSKIERDAEVRDFVIRNITSMTFGQLAQACRQRFGADRAPSKSSMHRFWSQYSDWLLMQEVNDDQTGG